MYCSALVLTCRTAGVMNMLTATHAISLFPCTTFINEQTFACRDLSRYPNWNAPWIDKYRKRGFDVFVASDLIPTHFELTSWTRKVGDALTWILPYKRIGESPRVLQVDAMSLTGGQG